MGQVMAHLQPIAWDSDRVGVMPHTSHGMGSNMCSTPSLGLGTAQRWVRGDDAIPWAWDSPWKGDGIYPNTSPKLGTALGEVMCWVTFPTPSHRLGLGQPKASDGMGVSIPKHWVRVWMGLGQPNPTPNPYVGMVLPHPIPWMGWDTHPICWDWGQPLYFGHIFTPTRRVGVANTRTPNSQDY